MGQGPRKPEVLAPAGSPAALAAALRHGADAVYFGLSDGFNARARAENFGLADLPATCARIHRAGARAYLTLNTLVFEPELPAVERVLRAVVAAGVDALIVQDPAVCLLARAVCPELELHASTQMTISEPAAAAFARDLGVTRVVVPRELSVDEIRQFAAGTELELEAFVHGALCVSWSGQCLTSEAWGGRSANRGQCAQSCRMPYDLVVDGRQRDLGDVRYLLSPKDLAGARAVPELADLVHGLKIEGRQKGPQYVATAVAGYRRWVDAIARGDERKQAERQLAQDMLAMALSYSRGFAAGFLDGSDHQTLVEGRFPKHRGVYVGRVARVEGRAVVVRREDAGQPRTGEPAPLVLQKGMGVVFDQGDPEDKNEPGGPLFFVDERGDELRLGFGEPGPDLACVRAGDRVFATSDPGLAALARAGDEEPTGRVPVTLCVRGQLGQPLVAVLAGRHARAEGATAVPLQPARGAGIDAALLRDKLGAFGGTPFALVELDSGDLAPGLHVPPGELKELRRRLVQDLLPQIEAGPVRRVVADSRVAVVRGAAAAAAAAAAGAAGPPDAAAVVPLVREEAQLDAAIAAGCAEVELDWMEFTGLGKAVERARAAGVRVTVATPRIGKPGEEQLLLRIRRLGPDGVLVRHVGALMRFLAWREAGDAMALHGDFALNATNSLTALHLLGHGLQTVTAALDLDETQLFALLAHVPGERIAVIAHHRIPTFHTEHCVYAHLLGSGRDFRTCGRPCEHHRVALRDHLGREHPVIVDVGCRNTVFHHEPQQAAQWTARLLQHGVRRFRCEFVRETAAEVATVLGALRELLAGQVDAGGYAERTGAVGQIGVAAGGMRLLTD